MLDNQDGFFDHLPPGPIKKRFGAIFKEDAEVVLQRQLLLQEERLAKNKRALRKLIKNRDEVSDISSESSSSSDEDSDQN